ncbi:MAG: murein hydrolase activator EnvC family protein [Gaiellaceae bacterium]
MARRLAIVLAFALLGAGSASGQGSDDRKQAIDEKISRLRDKIAAANRQEGVLTSEISAVTARIRGLQDDVDSASSRVATLEGELIVYKNRLAVLTQVYRLQTEKLILLRREHALAQRRLEERLIAIYQSESLSTVEVILTATSFTELLDGLDYVNEIGLQDRRIAGQVARAKRDMRVARARTERTRVDVAETTREVEIRTEAQRAERDRLIANRESLADARGEKRRTLAAVQTSEREFLHEVAGLEQASAALAARIQAAQSSSPSSLASPSAGAVSSRGLIWPVSGPVTSAFGWRWGRMHEGIDIAAPTGAPIQAAASGTVIYSGWMSGYGNLVVIDHGGGLATAYAHESSIAVGTGQAVSQGQIIGYVGCTGHCFGSHLHFEVRVNGAAVDPLGYL